MITTPRCSNVNPGTFNHECGKLASFQGTHSNGHKQWFCTDCRKYKFEAMAVKSWLPIEKALAAASASTRTAELSVMQGERDNGDRFW